MPITILGIRHHGAGSARYVLERLRSIKPDLLMVEGPPEVDAVTKWIGTKELKPPVAVLCYDGNKPQRAVFFPFSEFSPEWQAIAYANKHKIPVRMMDLPAALSWEIQIKEGGPKEEQEPAEESLPNGLPVEPSTEIFKHLPPDPLLYFASIAGYKSADLWWEHHFEQKHLPGGAEEHFEAVALVMHNLRSSGVESSLDRENEYREAYMAQLIRKAQNELYQNIVVVCGAWHGPALLDLDKTEKEHAKVLKKLPKSKIKVGATWIPWTNSRLSFVSGYGAGISSPGWYTHLWKHPEDLGQRWLTKVAHLFRQKKMDISTAHVIEAYRLAESLAAMRNLSRPGLLELNEATTTVMCMGDSILLKLVETELIVGHALGKVPDNLPKLPLQADFEDQVRALRLPQTAERKDLELDLRKELDLKRSVFLFRLQVLGIKWAQALSTRSKGTFRESWGLSWNPEMGISLIEMGIFGNTVEEAASRYLYDCADGTDSIVELSGMIRMAIPAELFAALEYLLGKINDQATVSADILELMSAVAPLADVGRYGNVRKTDMEAVNILVEGLVIRICIGLPVACYGMDEESAAKMFEQIRRVNEAVRLLELPDLTTNWFETLEKIAQKDGIPAILAGCTCRLLFDARQMERAETARRFSLALSAGNESAYSAGWIEGFLKGSGMILLLDDVLWNLLHKWVAELNPEAFTHLIPILRRTFSKFPPGERRQLGEKALRGTTGDVDLADAKDTYFDAELGEKALPLVARMLGL